MTVSRRKFLQGSGVAGISAATLATFPASIQKALAIPANNKTGTIQDVEHVVILMQENRSFDNYFGTLKGIRGLVTVLPYLKPMVARFGNSLMQQRNLSCLIILTKLRAMPNALKVRHIVG